MQEIVLSSPEHSAAAISWCTKVATSYFDYPTVSSGSVEVLPLQVEASHRLFFRLTWPNQPSLVFMFSPPELENNQAFVELAQLFARFQVPVPHLIAKDLDQGWVLMTDLGQCHLADLYGTDNEDAALTAAVQEMVKLSAIEHPIIPPYTAQRMRDELEIFKHWLCTEFLQVPLRPGLDDEFEKLVHATQVQPQCCVHRDFHSRNLLFDGTTFGIVDFQDALRGPVMYDPASLLQDCYHEFPEATIDRWLDHIVRAHPLLKDVPREQIKEWFDFTAVQRQLKAVGIFVRLHLRDRKTSHLKHIVPVLQRLQRCTAQYPELTNTNLQLTDCLSRASDCVEQATA